MVSPTGWKPSRLYNLAAILSQLVCLDALISPRICLEMSSLFLAADMESQSPGTDNESGKSRRNSLRVVVPDVHRGRTRAIQGMEISRAASLKRETNQPFQPSSSD
jgi:hypothetical protein